MRLRILMGTLVLASGCFLHKQLPSDGDSGPYDPNDPNSPQQGNDGGSNPQQPGNDAAQVSIIPQWTGCLYVPATPDGIYVTTCASYCNSIGSTCVDQCGEGSGQPGDLMNYTNVNAVGYLADYNLCVEQRIAYILVNGATDCLSHLYANGGVTPGGPESVFPYAQCCCQ